MAPVTIDLEEMMAEGNDKEDSNAAGDEEEGEEDYVPLKERKKREAELRAKSLGLRKRDRAAFEKDAARAAEREAETKRRIKEAEQRERAAEEGGGSGSDDDDGEGVEGGGSGGKDKPKTLLMASKELRKAREDMDEETLRLMKIREEEERVMKDASTVGTNALLSAAEIASGIKYTQSLQTSWRPPRYIREQSPEEARKLRDKWHILVEGEDIPSPVKSFREMKFPQPILDALMAKGIKRPTPIQVQGVPCALSGRDMIGIAFTGSGKTVTFSLPLVMLALEEEMKLPIKGGEGPFGIILCPSRELARQTFEVVQYFSDFLTRARYPEIRCVLTVGGEDKRAQYMPVQQQGVHCIVATPGRLADLLNSGKIHMDLCKYICLDEGDRMLDLGFDEEVRSIMNHFKQQRQTLLFSATMPQKFQDFAKNVLVRPVLVNVGRAGAANLDVIQEVEYVKEEAKIVYLLECLQKTAPPVCIFCEKKQEVDDIHEYLLLKGVDAVSIHGGKDQADRNEAIRLFKDGYKDVLIATDVAAKGLDFPDIQHVVNFDMPAEIENYIHRIGRTGRCGKTGVATTFINKSVEESALLDLKHLLIEAQQRVPPVLMSLDDPSEGMDMKIAGGQQGCTFCNGLGHRITNCPKLEKDARKLGAGRKDALIGSGGYGGDW